MEAILRDPAQASQPVFSRIDRADRVRLSAPALRTFRNIADQWQLTESERLALLGEPARSTYYAWLKKADQGKSLALALDMLLRISGVLGIFKALRILFPIAEQAAAWFNSPHAGTVFHGMSPREVIVQGGLDGILTVRRYLDAWRGGLFEHAGVGVDLAPIDETDLVFS
ncbi:MAG: hypothetical protein KatS3mg119_2045 [Rhodothalassiaceae bacterium]|nr:MAG: hypothetical protein KatS3mg119_2045 [Rhodothalassiaceae bacterium]